MTTTRIILIEDHDLTRIGLRTALQRVNGIEVAGEAATATQGFELVKTAHPDVAIVDIGLPDMDGIELTRKIREFQATAEKTPTRILILTMHENEESVLAAFAAGADSYCMKDISIERLTEALRTTSEGNSWIDPIIANIVLQKVRQTTPPTSDKTKTIAIGSVQPEMEQIIGEAPLTERELEILQLIVDGYSNAAIADKLFISLGTVKTHVRNILNKLCADDRTQAAVLALRSGLIS
ncbi:MAG: response regulator transcription factor [Oscillatoriales cyanobacterium C42_A2020_001]|nr:response regulator transcription factor [Leptolyngbyaceae cyanobacterium C42_A2020_001]